jgi:hypothetical protein
MAADGDDKPGPTKEMLATRIVQDVGAADGTTHMIFSVEAPCVLTNDNVPGDRNTTVYADRIEIHGPILRQGRKIALHAREITGVGSNAGIDVSGDSAVGTPDALPPGKPGDTGHDGERQGFSNSAATDGGAGQAGGNGSSGKPGAAAGSITVVAYRFSGTALRFAANGGNGSAGQTGGAGGRGGTGGKGAEGFTYGHGAGRGGVIWKHVQGGNGGHGGNGANGGNGGNGGDGGAAGHVDCRHVVHEAAPIVSATPGSGGAAGGAGAAGAAGAGGQEGGSHDDSGGGNHGLVGGPGAPGTAGKAGATGAAGSASATVVTLADMKLAVHPIQAGMMLQQAKLGYISADPDVPGSFTAPSAALRWLFDTTASYAATPAPQNTGFSASDLQRFAGINSQAHSLLKNMSQHRDAFGNSFAWAPGLSYDYCNETLGKLCDEFDAVGAALDKYLDLQAVLADRQAGAASGLGSARGKLGSIADRIADLDKSIESSAEDIGTLMDGVQTAQDNVRTALGLAADAVVRKTGCKLDSLFQALGMIAMTDPETSMFSKVVATQAAGALNGLVEQNDYATIGAGQVRKDYLVAQIQNLNSEVSSLDEGYKRLGTTSKLVPDDPNCYKVKATAAEIEQGLKPYTSLDEVKAVIADVDKLVAASQALNDGILQYNAFVSQKSEVIGQKAQLDADIGDYETIISQITDFGVAGITAMLMRTYHQMRDDCISMIYMTSRTFGYWSVSRPDVRSLLPTSGDVGPTQVHTAKGTVLGLAFDANAHFRKPRQYFSNPTGKNPNPIVLDDKDLLASFQRADKTGSYTLYYALPLPTTGVNINDNHFAGMRNVRISEIQVYLDGATADGELNITVTRGGREQIANAVGDVLTFETDPVTTQFSYDPKSPTLAISRRATFAASDNDVFAAVGPFCTWTFQIDSTLNTKVDLSGLKSVSLVFFGHCI